MFESFYGFSVDPFRLTPECQVFFEHRSFSKARAYIDYALLRGEGIVLVTGRPGTGKSTLIRELQSRMAGSDIQVAVVSNARLEAEDLMLMLFDALGLNARQGQGKATLLLGLSEYLRTQQRHGKRVLLVIDEAQDLSVSALEELRLLTNLEHAGRPLVQVLLVGQESLGDLVRSEPLEQLRQRIVASWELVPLTPEETVSYVQHRLLKAGWRGNPAFLPGVLKAIHGFSLGVPRLINLVCSRLLLRGFCLESHELSVEDAEAVLDELHEERLVPRAVDSAQVLSNNAGGQGVDWSLLDQGLTLSVEDDTPPTVAETSSGQAEPRQDVTPLESRMGFEVEPSSRDDWDSVADQDDVRSSPSVSHAPSQASDMYDLSASLVHEDPYAPESMREWRHDDPFMVPPITNPSVPHRDGLRPRPRFPFGYVLMGLVFLGVAGGAGVYWLLPEQWARIERVAKHWIETALVGLLPAADQGLDPLGGNHSTTETNAAMMTRSQAPAGGADETRLDSRASTLLGASGDSSDSSDGSPLDGRPTLGSLSSVSESNTSISQGESVSQSNSDMVSAVPHGLEATSSLEDERVVSAVDHESVEAAGGDVSSRGNASSELADVSLVETVDPGEEDAEAASASPPLVMETRLLVEVGFKFNSSAVNQEYAEALDKVVALMTSSDLAMADIQGFTDNTGPPDYNVILARRRAQAVVVYLIKRGISSERLSVKEGGIYEPENSLSGRRASGRLVEVRVLGPVTHM